MDHLTKDPAFIATTFIVIDFETTTPAWSPAEPVEVAAVSGPHGPDEPGRDNQLPGPHLPALRTRPSRRSTPTRPASRPR